MVVAEARGDPAERFGETLPPDILLALDRLGLNERFRADGHLPCPGTVSLWGGDRPGHNDFILNPLGPAWHIDRARFEAMLRDRAALAGASVEVCTRAVWARPTGGGFDVRLDGPAGGRWVHAAWVIDATGSRAWFARALGARRRREDRMVAILRLATLTSGPFTQQTVIEATPDGWWYCARLPRGRIVTMHAAQPGDARLLTAGDHAGWRRRLAETTSLTRHLDGCTLESERFRACPLVTFRLDPVAGGRWLAIGDAATTFDPLAARGIHKAFADAADACRTITGAMGPPPSPPSAAYRACVEARYADYRNTCAHLYAVERRWADQPFWRARAAARHAELLA